MAIEIFVTAIAAAALGWVAGDLAGYLIFDMERAVSNGIRQAGLDLYWRGGDRDRSRRPGAAAAGPGRGVVLGAAVPPEGGEVTREGEAIAALDARMDRSEAERRGLWEKVDTLAQGQARLEVEVALDRERTREYREELTRAVDAIGAKLDTLTETVRDAQTWARALRWVVGALAAGAVWVLTKVPDLLASIKAWRW